MEDDCNYNYWKKCDYDYDYDCRAMITITVTDYSMTVTVYIGFLQSAANIQGVISLITCFFMHHLINLHKQM